MGGGKGDGSHLKFPAFVGVFCVLPLSGYFLNSFSIKIYSNRFISPKNLPLLLVKTLLSYFLFKRNRLFIPLQTTTSLLLGSYLGSGRERDFT